MALPQPIRLRPCAALCLVLLCAASVVSAAPTLRHQVEQRGDLLVFGNTLGFDCRPPIPKPLVGAVDINACGVATADSEIDVLWRADDPAVGQASAGTAITPDRARSTALLRLPPGAVVTFARLYWAAAQDAGTPAGQTALLERPGAFAKLIQAEASARVDGTSSYYQSSADITEIVQDLGEGTFRLGAIAAASPVGRDSQLSFAAWSVVVLYKRDLDPPRNLTVFDGLDRVDDTRPAGAMLERFLVPDSGFDGKLAIIAYEGDSETAGDRLRLNGQDLFDEQNPADNFFNGTRGVLGQALSIKGDLPQMSGAPGSENGVDLDVVDVTGRLAAGAISAAFSATSSEDVYFLGVLAGSIATRKPGFVDTHLTYLNRSNPGGAVRPGDRLELTLVTRNNGSDSSLDTIVSWTAPPELDYIPGSLRIGSSPRTDSAGDDEGDYDEGGRTLRARIGAGADRDRGGSIAPEEPNVIVRFQVRVKVDAADKEVRTQASVRAAGVVGTARGIPPMSWSSGDGIFPARRTRVLVRDCEADRDCPLSRPRCDAMTRRCGNGCQAAADCAGRPTGSLCLPAMTCGCAADGDCPQSTCEVGTALCRIPESDLVLEVRTEPDPPARGQPLVHVLTVTNRGPDAAPSVTVRYTVPEGGAIRGGPEGGVRTGPGWQCELKDRTLLCLRAAPLPKGPAPSIRVTVDPPPGKGTIEVDASAASPFSTDPLPEDNNVAGSIDLSPDLFQLAGGGVSCAAKGPGPDADRAQLLCLLIFFIAWTTARRRARP